jgi:hypothetical protein
MRKITYRDRGGDDLGCRVGRLLVLRLDISGAQVYLEMDYSKCVTTVSNDISEAGRGMSIY